MMPSNDHTDCQNDRYHVACVGKVAQCTVKWRRTFRTTHKTNRYCARLGDLSGEDRPQLFHAWLQQRLPVDRNAGIDIAEASV